MRGQVMPLALAVALVGIAAVSRDAEAAAIGVGIGAGALLAASSRRPLQLPGRIVVAVLAVDTIIWMLPAAYSNVTHRDALWPVARSVVLVVLAAVSVLPERRRPPIVVVAVAGVALVGAARLPGVGNGVDVQAGDVVVSIRTNEFSVDELVVDAGALGIAVSNHDLFWHTFTVEALDLDIRVPNGATRRADLHVAPGRYEFVCAIPGHELAGMEGTLVVRNT